MANQQKDQEIESLKVSEQVMKSKLDETMDESNTTKQELEQANSTVVTVTQQLDEQTSELDGAKSQISKMDSELTGLHDKMKELAKEHEVDKMSVRQECDTAAACCSGYS